VKTDVENIVSNSVIPSLLPSPLPKLTPNTFVVSQKTDGSQNWHWYFVGSKNSILLQMMPLSMQSAFTFDKDSTTISNSYSDSLFYKSAEDAVKAVQKVKELAMKNENFMFDIPRRLVLLSSTPSISETFNAQVIEISMTNSQQKSLNSRLRRRMKMGSFTVSAELSDEDGNDGNNEIRIENEKQKPQKTVLAYIQDIHAPRYSLQSFLESPNYQASTLLSLQHAISQSSLMILNHPSPSSSSSSSSDVSSTDPANPSMINMKLDSLDSMASVTPKDFVRAMEANVAAITSLDSEVSHLAELLVYICMLVITFAVSMIMGGVLWRKVQDRQQMSVSDKEYMLETV
jgi:hypothetical protein